MGKRERPSPDRAERGFVLAYIGDRWCGAWYETYYSAVTVASGKASACAHRLRDLPARFEALFLLYRLARAHAPGMVCRSSPA